MPGLAPGWRTAGPSACGAPKAGQLLGASRTTVGSQDGVQFQPGTGRPTRGTLASSRRAEDREGQR
jgi:hypothetical protein